VVSCFSLFSLATESDRANDGNRTGTSLQGLLNKDTCSVFIDGRTIDSVIGTNERDVAGQAEKRN
jgi:hypothetical protein